MSAFAIVITRELHDPDVQGNVIDIANPDASAVRITE